MKHLKLYEDFENPNFLIDIVKKQALRYNKPEVLAMVVEKGFESYLYKPQLIRYCENRGLHDSIKMLDSVYHQKLVEQTSILNLGGRRLKGLQLNSLINLKELDCSSNKLTDLKGIEKLTNLNILYCGDNDLKNIKETEGLINLNVLYCSNNNLKEIKIKHFHKLTRLACSFNNLTDLKGIENLNDLTFLHCTNNDFPLELEAFGNDISEWEEYYRNN